MKVTKLEDMVKAWMESEDELSKKVYIDDGSICINVEYEYPIDLVRCDTPEKLLSWVFHLSEKTWMTNDVMRRFVAVASSEHGFNLGLS